MKKKLEKLAGIMLLGLILFGTQSCNNASNSMDNTPLSTVQTESRRGATTPTLTTNPLTSVTATSSVSGGNITATGGRTITASGVCWSTTANPTKANHVVANSNVGSLSFSCTLSSLPASTVYYVRAYATNSAGLTGYGNQITSTVITTTPPPPPPTATGYAAHAPISLSGVSGQTIQGVYIANTSGIGISLSNCHDMVITKSKISHTGGNGIYLYNCYNITITHCEIDSVKSGLYAVNCTGGIDFNYNDTKNILGPFPQAQMVQFNGCSGANNQINYNTCDNIPGHSSPEDLINMYKSTGTAASPIMITGNYLRGGGPSGSGGGIMLGDNGGGYQTATNNILVNPGQYGMSVSGGSNIIINGNQIYAKSQPFTNVGLYIWNQNATACANNTIENNRVNYYNKSGVLNNFWNGSSSADGTYPICTGTVWTNNVADATLSASILPTVLFGTNQ